MATSLDASGNSTATSELRCHCRLVPQIRTSFMRGNLGRRFAACNNYPICRRPQTQLLKLTYKGKLEGTQSPFQHRVDVHSCCDRGRSIAKLAAEKIATLKQTNSHLQATNTQLRDSIEHLTKRVAELEMEIQSLSNVDDEGRAKQLLPQRKVQCYNKCVFILTVVVVVVGYCLANRWNYGHLSKVRKLQFLMP